MGSSASKEFSEGMIIICEEMHLAVCDLYRNLLEQELKLYNWHEDDQEFSMVIQKLFSKITSKLRYF